MSRVVVTDHAVLRYIERAYNLDIEDIRAGIARVCARGVAHGAPYVTHRRMRYVLRGDSVVTTLRAEWVWHLDTIRRRQAHHGARHG